MEDRGYLSGKGRHDQHQGMCKGKLTKGTHDNGRNVAIRGESCVGRRRGETFVGRIFKRDEFNSRGGEVFGKGVVYPRQQRICTRAAARRLHERKIYSEHIHNHGY